MRATGAVGAGLVIAWLALTSWPVPSGWGQTFAGRLRPLAETLSEATVAMVLIAAATVVLVLAVLGKMLELKDRRAAEGIAVQGEILDALHRDPKLLGLSMTPKARVPLWRGTPVTVRVVGEVPSAELRKAAVRAAERGASDLLVRVRIKSRIRIVKPKARRTA